MARRCVTCRGFWHREAWPHCTTGGAIECGIHPTGIRHEHLCLRLRFGGSGEQIYWLELNRRLEAASVSCQAYESLNQSTTDMAAYAARVVSSAEEIVRPKRVFIAMPFDKRFDPIIGRANANVFFEVGLARGLGKPVMLAAKRGSEVPFDVTDMQRIIYGTLAELERDLEVWLQSLSVVPARPVVRTENAAVPRKTRPKH